MKILSYECKDSRLGNWEFTKIDFSRINLIVGNSGSGKTRFLNTIFNLARIVVGSINPRYAFWKIKFKIADNIYDYELQSEAVDNDDDIITKEELILFNNTERRFLIKRNKTEFKFNNDLLPKLPSNRSGISLLKEEEEIAPIYTNFAMVLRRNFSENEFAENFKIPLVLDHSYEKIHDIKELLKKQLNTNLVFNVLKKNFKDIYKSIIFEYKNIFSFIQDIEIRDINEFRHDVNSIKIPVLAVKEKNLNDWIPINDLSSGMKKVLLILLDLYSLPEGGIYLIDEYENSLGANAINFLPPILNSIETDIQIFITSHHPYLINNIPLENWIIFNRKGMHVDARFGNKNKELFSKSKHDKFIQLMNDPFYNQGVE